MPRRAERWWYTDGLLLRFDLVASPSTWTPTPHPTHSLSYSLSLCVSPCCRFAICSCVRFLFPTYCTRCRHKSQNVLAPHTPDTAYGWMTQDLHAGGVAGDATDADEVRV